MTGKEKKRLRKILIAAAAFSAVWAADKIFDLASILGGGVGFLLPLALYICVYIYIGYDVVVSAAKNVANGQVFDEKFLMAIASLGAIALAVYGGITGTGFDGAEEACAVMILYKLGNFFEHYATGKARNSITKLLKLRPDRASVLRGGEFTEVSPEDVKIGEQIEVKPGERVPLDGVACGASLLDTKALTGESMPVEISEGDEVLSGSVNLTNRLVLTVKTEFHDSTVSKILYLVEQAAEKKSKSESFISRFAKYYTPTVVISAILLAIIPSLILGNASVWIYRALNFLVVSCPCALVISVPLAFVSGIGGASKSGIIVKGGNVLEAYERVKTFAFDKTGTLTEGKFGIIAITPEANAEEILAAAAIAEQASSHPIARCIADRYKKSIPDGYTLTEIAGRGVRAEKQGEIILCGNKDLMYEAGIECESAAKVGTVVYVAKNGEYLGSVLVADKIKPEAQAVIGELREKGYKTVMLTGDGEEPAARVAKELGLSAYSAALLPSDKTSEVEKLLDKDGKDKVCFIGDGINDAPPIATADVGVAMGNLGSDAAIEAADAAIMKDDLTCILKLKRIAKKTMRIVRENVYGSIAIKLAVLVLAAAGLVGMWVAVLGDVGVAAIAILNSLRAGKTLKTAESK